MLARARHQAHLIARAAAKSPSMSDSQSAPQLSRSDIVSAAGRPPLPDARTVNCGEYRRPAKRTPRPLQRAACTEAHPTTLQAAPRHNPAYISPAAAHASTRFPSITEHTVPHPPAPKHLRRRTLAPRARRSHRALAAQPIERGACTEAHRPPLQEAPWHTAAYISLAAAHAPLRFLRSSRTQRHSPLIRKHSRR